MLFAQEAIGNFLSFFPTLRCGSTWAEPQSKPRYCFVDDGRSIPSQIGRIQPEVPPRSLRGRESEYMRQIFAQSFGSILRAASFRIASHFFAVIFFLDITASSQGCLLSRRISMAPPDQEKTIEFGGEAARCNYFTDSKFGRAGVK